METKNQHTSTHPEKRRRIDALLQHAALWRASDSAGAQTSSASTSNTPVVATQFPEIDALLCHAGWPLGQLIECMHPPDSHAALFPFLPALGSLTDDTHSALQRTSSKLPN